MLVHSDLVNYDRMATFIYTEVAGRKKRKGEGRGKDTIGVETIRQYASAIKDLWTLQRDQQRNPHAVDPRGDLVKTLIATARAGEHQRHLDNFEDPAAGTLLDGYTTAVQLGQITDSFLTLNTPAGLRDRLALLLCHAALLRGNNVRGMELSQLQTHVLPAHNEGYTRSVAYQLVLRNGKSNQTNNVEYGAFLRAREVESCAVGAMAMHLFYRLSGVETFTPDGRTFPDLTNPEKWYRLKLLPGRGSKESAVDYNTHNAATKRAFEECGFSFTAKTHAMRGSACRMADIGGAPEESIKRLGRWEQGAAEVHYLKTMPVQAMRVLAGFRPSGGDYWLKRGAFDPPQELACAVFPQVEEYEAWFVEQAKEKKKVSGATKGFIQLLKELRPVLLQDAVLLRRKFPQYFLWDNKLFSSASFIAFEAAMLANIDTVEDPSDLQMRRLVPELFERLDTVYAAHTLSLKQIRDETADLKRTVEGGLKQVSSQQQDFFSGRVPWTVSVQVSPPVQPAGFTAVQIHDDAPSMSETEEEHISSGPITLKHTDFMSPMPAHSPAPTTVLSGPVPVYGPYAMSRRVETVEDAWREYQHGLGGRTPVREAYEGKKIHRDSLKHGAEQKFWNRRRQLITYIKEQAALRGLTCEAMAIQMEVYRLSLPKRDQSLSKVQEAAKRGSLLPAPSSG